MLINYSVGSKRYEKTPDKHDLELIEKIENSDIPYWFPIEQLPDGYNTRQPKISHGLTHVHHFYTRRNLLVLAAVFQVFTKSRAKFLFTSSLINCTKLYRYRTNNKGGNVSGTLYVPSTPQENNVIRTLLRKLDDCLFNISNTEINIENCSASREQDIDSSVDYIFTDPLWRKPYVFRA